MKPNPQITWEGTAETCPHCGKQRCGEIDYQFRKFKPFAASTCTQREACKAELASILNLRYRRSRAACGAVGMSLPAADALRSRWVNGLAEWVDGDTAYLSIAFTWRLDDAYMRAIWQRALGRHVIAGGPALFQEKVRHRLDEVAEIPTRELMIDGKLRIVGANHPSGEAVLHHNPLATVASRGCPVGCSFCIVPWMEGTTFTELPDFPVRPILCDNNLSALSAAYQDHIVGRYIATGTPLIDANSGFEPQTLDDEVYARWRVINKGPWRFAYDEQKERAAVERVTRMLRHLSPRKKQVYTLIGNEPFASCMERIAEVRAWGCEPYAQPLMKLNAPEKRPWVRYDWTEGLLARVQRWCNYSSRSGVSFKNYDASAKTSRVTEGVDDLFAEVAA